MTRLRAKRKAMGIKQVDLAYKAQVSAAFMSDLEIGRRTAKAETWQRIADALGCTVEDIHPGVQHEQ